MATLFNTRISDTYVGLIKTTDNAAISATLKQLSDGSGNLTGLYLNNAGDFKVTSILEFGSLKDTAENIVITKFVDAADGITNNNNDTSIPTSKAVKDFVETHVTAQDLDFRGDDASVAGDVDLDSEAFIILGTANEIETTVTSAGGNTIQIGLPNNVTITSDLSAVNLNASSLLTTLDMRLKGSINVLNKAGNNYQAFAQRDVTGSTAVINLNNIGAIGASGTITAPTFSGQLSGTISSATTATTQSAGDNSTKVATTAYVDSLDAGSDLDFSGDAGTGAVVLNTETLAVTGTTSQIETTASGTGLNLKFPTAGVVLPNGSTATTQADSDDSTKVATTAFVKSLNNASDLDFSGDSGTGDVTLNTQTFSVIGTVNQIETTASNQQLQLNLPSSINVNSASATALQTARDISLTGQATATISGFDGSSDVSGAVTLDNNSVTGKVLTGLASPTASNILASDSILQAFGKAQSQINTLAGGLRFMGTWNANTNTPTLASGGGEADSGTTTGTATNKLIQSGQNFTSSVTNGDKVINQASGATALVTNVDSNTQLTLDADIMVSGQEYTIDNSPFITQGHYFVVSVGGTSSLNGLSNWAVGDWVIAGAGNVWEKLDHTQVDGTGTAGKIAKFSSTNVIADSLLTESGSTISFTGELGISNATPQQKLDTPNIVIGGASISASYRANSTMMDNLGGVARFYSLGADNSTAGSYQFNCLSANASAGAGTVMTITPTGNVGIGVAVPDSRLDVTGGDITVNTSGTGFMNFKYGSLGSENVMGTITTDGVNLKVNATSQLQLRSGNSLALTLEADQDAKFEKKVGIGITPAEVLDLKAASGDTRIRLDAVSGSDTEIKFFNDGTAQYTIGHDDDSDEFRIAYANVEAPIVKIDKSYNVVIGTLGASETGTLTVNNEGGNTPTAKFMSRTNKSIVQISDNDTTGYLSAENGLLSIGRAAGVNANNINIDAQNEVGFGTSEPNHKVDIYSTANIGLRLHRPSNSNLDSSSAQGIGFSTRGDGVTSTTDTRAGIFSYYNGNLFLATGTSDITADPYASRRIMITGAGATTITGTLDVKKAATFNSIDSNASILMNLTANDGNNAATFRTTATGKIFEIRSQNSGTIKIDSSSTTFTGDVIVPNGKISTTGGNNLTISGSVADHAGLIFATNSVLPAVVSAETNNVVDLGQNGNVFKNLYLGSEIISGGGATFAGNVKAPTLEIESTSIYQAKIKSTGAQYLLIGSTDAGSAGIVLDGDSNGDGSGGDYSYIIHETTGVLKVQQDSPSGTNELHFGTAGTEGRMIINSGGDILMGNTVVNPASGFASQKGFGYDAGTGQTQIATTDNASTLVLGRNNATDGSIIDLRKESGVIGTFGSNTVGGQPLLDISANATNGNMRFVTAGSEALRIDSSQNVRTYAKLGIRVDGDAIPWRGTAQIPAVINLAGNGAVFTRPDKTFLSQNFYYDANDSGAVIDAGKGSIIELTAGEIKFQNTTNGASSNATVSVVERMRISDNDIYFGATSTSYPTTNNFVHINTQSAVSMTIGGHSGTHTAVQFRHNGATTVGSIVVNSSSTTYNTSSDYRLKEDLQDFNGLDKVSKIPVYDFKWKTNKSRSYGVMAHELQEVLPDAVTEEKDAEKMQQVDYSKIVPLLVKSIQELKAEVDLLKEECKCK